MSHHLPELRIAADAVIAAIRRLRERLPRPVLVALDGASGSGKSTLACMIAEELDAALVPIDDFFAANITDAQWDARTPAQRAADVFDWQRVRAEALEPLLAGRPAEWHAFDFLSGPRPDGVYGMCAETVKREPRPIIVLDGAYATGSELADLIDLSVLVDAPLSVRHQRLASREEKVFLVSWHARWDPAEDWYFTQARPKSSFDMVVINAPYPVDH